MAMKKSISRTLAHIDVAATVPFAFTKTFSTPTGIITSYLKTGGDPSHRRTSSSDLRESQRYKVRRQQRKARRDSRRAVRGIFAEFLCHGYPLGPQDEPLEAQGEKP
jgi:hypothetical protein